MARALLYLVIWVVQAVAIVLFVKAPWVSHELEAERAWTAQQWGQERAQVLREQAEAQYQRTWVASGIVNWSYSALIPDPNVSQQGMETLAPWFFVWLKKRIDVFWWLVYQGIFRVQLIRAWFPYIGCLALAAMVEGFVQRAIKRANVASESGDRYAVAQGSLLVLIFAPLVYLSAPLAVTPQCVPVWGGLLVAGIAVLTANVQQQV